MQRCVTLNLSQYYRERHQPDILDCIANLSSDEVFTPPELADKILDLLPPEVWHNKDLTFLDPATKTGVFLRQIATRLMEGLKDVIPDEAERREHIFKNQLYGLPITQLTALMSRRTVYYSKDTTRPESAVQFDQPEGNIRYQPRKHTYTSGKCTRCGQAEGEGIGTRLIDGTLETHAYEFIHLTPEEAGKMKFDVIVGNPPYQLGDGGHGASAMPIYQKFVEQAKTLKPRYMAFIIPSRWFAGGKGLDGFRADMLADRHMKELVDYPNASDCFPGVEIKGGVCYFIWDAQHDGDCNVRTILGDEELPAQKRKLNEYSTFIRYNSAIPILEKVRLHNEETFDKIVSSSKPFGFRSFFDDFDQIDNPDKVKIYASKKQGYIRRERVQVNARWIDEWKVLTARSNNIGTSAADDNLNTIVAAPRSCCTETYMVVGANLKLDEASANNLSQYMKTRFVRFLISLRKVSQDATAKVYSFVPLLTMNEPWTDEKLYARYDIDADEQAFIESMIKEMV